MAASISAIGAESRDSRRVPRYKWTSARENAASSLVVPVYSPGRKRKKKAMQIISAIARSAADEGSVGSKAERSTCRTSVTGMGRTLRGAGSILLQERSC